MWWSEDEIIGNEACSIAVTKSHEIHLMCVLLRFNDFLALPKAELAGWMTHFILCKSSVYWIFSCSEITLRLEQTGTGCQTFFILKDFV